MGQNAEALALGIVTRVQRIPDGPFAPDIGYIIPVAALSAVWPPPAPKKD